MDATRHSAQLGMFWPYVPVGLILAVFHWPKQRVSQLFQTGRLKPHGSDGVDVWCLVHDLMPFLHPISPGEGHRRLQALMDDGCPHIDVEGYVKYRIAAQVLGIHPHRIRQAAHSGLIEAKANNIKPHPKRREWLVNLYETRAYFERLARQAARPSTPDVCTRQTAKPKRRVTSRRSGP